MDSEYFKTIIDAAAWDLREGILAMGYKNLKTEDTYFYNENHIFPAASIVKVPILLEYLRQKDEGILKDQDEVVLEEKDIVTGAGILLEMHRGLKLTLGDLARLMIVISDNTASNILLDKVGMENVNSFMNKIGLSDTVVGRKFMIDPNAKFSKNFVTIKDMVLLYDKLYKGEILSRQGTKEALDIMSRQQYQEKIPLLLPNNIKIAHKTGEITGVRHDCAIIFHKNGPYILCVLTEKLKDVVFADRIIGGLSRQIFDELTG